MKKILILSNYELSSEQSQSFENCPNRFCQEAEFTFQSSGSFDFVCVMNTVATPHVLRAPSNGVIKIIQEPSVPNSIFHRFVGHHERKYSKVLGHRGAFPLGPKSKRFLEHGPLTFPQVSERFGHKNQGFEKTKTLSIISSKVANLEGHHRRNEFIDLVHKFNPELKDHTFGRGRKEILRKEEALDPYMYSLAVENSQIPSYITEKFLDCILRLTVPVYFGAQNVDQYFPQGAFVRLSGLDESSAKEILSGLSHDDYLRRLPVLENARDNYLQNMKLCCVISNQAKILTPGRHKLFIILPPLGEVIKNVVRFVRS